MTHQFEWTVFRKITKTEERAVATFEVASDAVDYCKAVANDSNNWRFDYAIRREDGAEVVKITDLEISETMPDSAFRDLSPEEEVEFKIWARENYTPGDPISGVWHPVIRRECHAMNSSS